MSSRESKTTLELLGLDPDNLEWTDLSICSSMETELFYEKYETSDSTAKMIDQACLSCPVLAQCLQTGMDNKEWGVWGGIYLTSGSPDKNRNSHKTEDIWEQIKERIVE